MHQYRIVDQLVEAWVEGPSTNVLGVDFCESAAFRRNAEEQILAPGLALYLSREANPRLALVVSETDVPVDGMRIAGLPVLLVRNFRRGQTFFRRKTVILEDDREPPRGSGCTI